MNGKLGLTRSEERVLRSVVFREPMFLPRASKDWMVSLAVVLALILVGPLLYLFASLPRDLLEEILVGSLVPLAILHGLFVARPTESLIHKLYRALEDPGSKEE